MSEDLEQLPARERAHTLSRERKARPPKVVQVNPGLRKVTMDLAEKRREAAKARKAARSVGPD